MDPFWSRVLVAWGAVVVLVFLGVMVIRVVFENWWFALAFYRFW